MNQCGYAGQILRVDLSTGQITRLPTARYSDRFLGGRGVAAKIYWDETRPETGPFDPENCLVFITGPLAGFTRFSGCRWQICGMSPEMDPEAFSYANLGGSWGAWLKYAGYDGLVVTGKSERLVYIYVDCEGLQIRDASSLRGKTTIETQNMLHSQVGKEAKIVCIGPAAENLVSFSTILAAENASGSSGLGSVLGSKNLKAVVVNADARKRPSAAYPDSLKALAQKVQKLRIGNFEDYGHILPGRMKLTSCYGCISGCTRGVYEAENGNKFKSFCQAAGVYSAPAAKYYGNGAEANLLAGRLCDKYGLDTAIMAPMLTWLEQCFHEGILGEEETGLPLSKFGSIEFIEKLVECISFRKGFGDVLAKGVRKAAKHVGKGSQDLLSAAALTRAGEFHDYDPRLILANALTYATEPRRSVHLHHATVIPLKRWTNWLGGWQDAFLSSEVLSRISEQFWGSAGALNFSTYSGKALATKKIQDYGYAKESIILCDLAWPIFQVHFPVSDEVPGDLESQIVSAVTGRDVDTAGLLEIGERNFNLQRSIHIRQGWGGRAGDNLSDFLFREPLLSTFFDPECLVPDAECKPVSRKGAVLDKNQFEKLKDEYYFLRGWDINTGYQTRTKLEQLDLKDIAEEMDFRPAFQKDVGS